MGKTKDLAGKRFGELVVLEIAEPIRGRTAWMCKCNCGKSTVVKGNSLKTGNTTTCGCLNKAPDLTGRRFGKLLVLSFAEQRGNQRYYNCQCDCGECKVVRADSLKTGDTISCGCVRIHDLSGQRFDRLLVLSRADNIGVKIAWLCQCDCGKTSVVSASSLKMGDTRSCGCSRIHDLTGKRFGKLLVTSFAEQRGTQRYYNCQCDCGAGKVVMGSTLVRGTTKSCGCLQLENSTKHGYAGTRIYACWKGLVQRTTNQKAPDYTRYGGRGITVCQSWRDSFETFLADMGEAPSDDHSIDRINNAEGYSRENCRWATKKEQSRNTRTNRLITLNGEARCIAEWCDRYPIKETTVRNRERLGWPLDVALMTPSKEKPSRLDISSEGAYFCIFPRERVTVQRRS